MSQYEASTLNFTFSFYGYPLPCTITDITWNGDKFSGEIAGIPATGTDVNGKISATAVVEWNSYSETGTVTSWS